MVQVSWAPPPRRSESAYAVGQAIGALGMKLLQAKITHQSKDMGFWESFFESPEDRTARLRMKELNRNIEAKSALLDQQAGLEWENERKSLQTKFGNDVDKLALAESFLLDRILADQSFRTKEAALDRAARVREYEYIEGKKGERQKFEWEQRLGELRQKYGLEAGLEGTKARLRGGLMREEYGLKGGLMEKEYGLRGGLMKGEYGLKGDFLDRQTLADIRKMGVASDLKAVNQAIAYDYNMALQDAEWEARNTMQDKEIKAKEDQWKTTLRAQTAEGAMDRDTKLRIAKIEQDAIEMRAAIRAGVKQEELQGEYLRWLEEAIGTINMIPAGDERNASALSLLEIAKEHARRIGLPAPPMFMEDETGIVGYVKGFLGMPKDKYVKVGKEGELTPELTGVPEALAGEVEKAKPGGVVNWRGHKIRMD